MPERWHAMPERWNAMPERWHAVPECWHAVLERRHAVPERWNAVLERWHAVPERWNAIPKPSMRFVIDRSRVGNGVLLCVVPRVGWLKSNTCLHIGSDTDNLMT